MGLNSQKSVRSQFSGDNDTKFRYQIIFYSHVKLYTSVSQSTNIV